jgi:predicted enzyme involved in methoxymalonyl-ACP biosynthesis
MSCRVFGRELEFEAMNIAVEAARQRGARALFADFIATSKNDVINGLYSRLGFASASPTTTTNGATRWVLDLADYMTRATHIARSGASQ